MNTKVLLTLLALLGWILFCNWWACNKLASCDTDNTAVTTNVDATTPTNTDIIKFDASANTPITGAGWATFRDSLANLIKGGKRLEITGYYTASETNNTKFENLGIARADTIRQLFMSQVQGLSAGRFNLRGEQKPDNTNPTMLVKDTVATPTDAGGIVATDSNDILIYFPSGSSNKELSKEVDDYLTKLGARLKASNEKAAIYGHTDNKGKFENNMALSKSRAESVKKTLISHGGIDANMSTDGKADKEPVGDNNTDAGRRQNRRVQIKITK